MKTDAFKEYDAIQDEEARSVIQELIESIPQLKKLKVTAYGDMMPFIFYR